MPKGNTDFKRRLNSAIDGVILSCSLSRPRVQRLYTLGIGMFACR
jgi:hypothetical protein